MANNPTPTISPYLLYEDATAAVEWLTDAFGLEERLRLLDPSGAVNHAELGLAEATIMLGNPGSGYQNPAHSGHSHINVYAYVEDVDAHCERARAAGATIVDEPADQFYGDRRYSALDPEGHHWFFATRVREVSEQEMAAAVAERA